MSTTTDATPCLTCDLVRRRDRGEAPPWDNIVRTAHWDIVHDYNTSLPGWLVLVARRHVAAIDELSDEEAAESVSYTHLDVYKRQVYRRAVRLEF